MIRTAAAAALGLALLAGCGAPPPDGARAGLVVFAAASLAEPFSRLGEEFEAARPGTTVVFSFDGSATLVDQLAAGAAADVLATADRASMERAQTAGLVTGSPRVFATNLPTLIVPAGNPARITGLDGSLAGRKLVVCAERVPCGAAARRLAAALRVTLSPVSEETRVSDVRAKVETGQADAGIVYATDARQAGDRVERIAVPGAERARNDYLAAVTARTAQAGPAAAFVAFVAGTRGRAVLEAAGFGG